MWDIILLFSSICTVVVGAPYTGYRGESFNISCSYGSGYESNSKYLCKGECSIGSRNIIVRSGSPAKDLRFSLRDDTTARVFTVTITDLRTADAGQYWCGVERTLADVFSEIVLLVKHEYKMTEVSTISPFTTTPSYFSTTEPYPQSSSITIAERTETIPDQHKSTEVSGSFVIIVTATALVLLLIVLLLIILAVWKSNKTQGLLSSSIVEFNPVLYEQIKDAGRDCNPEDRDTETAVVYTCAS